MTRFHLGCVCALAFMSIGTICQADEPNISQTDTAKALIDQLTNVSNQDTGYSASTSGASFLPLGINQTHVILFGQRSLEESSVMKSLVQLGLKALPTLLDHLKDDRKTKIVIQHEGFFGGLFITQDEGEKAEENFGEGFQAGQRYTVRVGDLCYVAIGQIVNRGYTAVRYQPTAIIYATSIPRCKQLRADLLKEWGGLTAEKHQSLLAKDLDSDSEYVRTGASLRMAYYYPDRFEPLALNQLARPTYDVFAVSDLIRKELYRAKTANERKTLVNEFVKQHGKIAHEGILWDLFNDLASQEADEEGRSFPKREPQYKARECLIEVFGLPANVTSKEKPKREPLAATTQARFVQTLLYDRGEKLDQVVRDILSKTDDDYMAEGCLARLVGRGYDSDIETYLKRRLPKMQEHHRKLYKTYETKLGWTRLHAAVELNVSVLIESALKDHLNVNAQSKSGQTALHLAAAAGSLQAIELLLNAKANPNVKDNQGLVAVQLASGADHVKAVRRLVEGKSHVPDAFTATIMGDVGRLTELIKANQDVVQQRNGQGYTPLHIAAREGNESLIEALLMAGADVNAKDLETDENRYPNGWAPLHLAILSQKVKATKLLLDKGADVNATDQYAKSTPLHFAAHLGNTELVKILLTAHANRDAKDAEKRTPLELAMKQGHTEVVKLLGGSN